MEINRNQWFMFGMILLLMGIQFRLVDTFVLNETVSQKLAEREVKQGSLNPFSPNNVYRPLLSTAAPAIQRKTIRSPVWLGWAMISVGLVLMAHSLSMKKPGG